MNNNKDINSLWTNIKTSQVLDPTVTNSIQKLILGEKPRETSINTRRSKRVNNRKSVKAKNSFGNPLRDVSEELIKFYKRNRKQKRIISPVFENLGFNK